MNTTQYQPLARPYVSYASDLDANLYAPLESAIQEPYPLSFTRMLNSSRSRGIKDTDLVAHILGKLLSSVTPDSLSAAKRDIDGMKNRKYRVRAPETFQHEMKGGTMVI